MRTFKISFALVVLFLTASTYTFSQTFEKIIVTKDSLGNNIYTKVPTDTINPTVKISSPTYRNTYKPVNTQKFFDNGITGINEVIWRIRSDYDLVGDYNGNASWNDGYASLLTTHMNMLNKRYGWGFDTVTVDTVRWILQHSEEVYEPFYSGQYTIFNFDRYGWMKPSTRSSNRAERIIKFHNIAYILCTSGGLMMPATEVGSYPVRSVRRHNIELESPIPYMIGELGFLYSDKQRDFKMVRHYARMHGMDAVMTPNGPWFFIPEDDSPSFGDILEVVLVLALIAFIVWLLWLLIFGNRRSVNESTVIISISNSTTIVLGEEDEPIDPSTHTMD